jgi:hypothetical protein
MPHRCLIDASYLKRDEASLKHVRDNSETTISLDLPVLLPGVRLVFSRLRLFSFESTNRTGSRLALKSEYSGR